MYFGISLKLVYRPYGVFLADENCERLLCDGLHGPDQCLHCKSDHGGEQEEWCDQDVEESQRGECPGWTQPVLRVADVCVSNKGLTENNISFNKIQ